ncbi:MAG: hypothetical protein JWQ07_4420 [Ramlibacter sp.]|nr:hypothetical protein [Ramlibacter sp.]
MARHCATNLTIAFLVTVALQGCGGGAGSSSFSASPQASPEKVSAEPVSGPATGVAAPLSKFKSALGAPQASADVLSAQIIDVYDNATNALTIPLVQVGPRFYKDVRINVGNVLSVGTAVNTSGVFDRYDPATNRLTVPVVRVDNELYYNVVATMSRLLSYGSAVESISVPTDLTQVSYPSGYQTSTTTEADINTDPCNLDIAKVTYPASWNGQYPLPAIRGAPLKQSIARAVMFKDIGLQPGNPAFILPGAPGAPGGCSGDLQTAFVKTMARLHTLGSDYITITQWHWATENQDGSWYFTKAEDTFGSMTDADTTGMVQKAHAAGLKVIMKNQIQGFYPFGNPSNMTAPPATAEVFAKWFPAFQAYIAERSVFFESLGVDVMEVGCGACLFHDNGDGSSAHAALFQSEYLKALDTIKLHFTGQVLMATPPWIYSSSLASKVDIFEVGMYSVNGAAQLTDSLTVDAYRALVANSSLQYAINLLDGYGKRIMISMAMQSRRSMFTLPGYVEETVCTAYINALNPDNTACIQREQLPDFSMQAIVYEASLEAINQMTTTHSTLMVNMMDYWETDSLMPFTAFPSLATSFRNKPAEGVVKAWFAR